MGNRSMFVGLDVHKETIDVSIAEGDRYGEVRHYGVIASDLEPLGTRSSGRCGRRIGPCISSMKRGLAGSELSSSLDGTPCAPASAPAGVHHCTLRQREPVTPYSGFRFSRL